MKTKPKNGADRPPFFYGKIFFEKPQKGVDI